LAGLAGAVMAVACCAGLPALSAVVGGLTLAAVFGVAGGVLLAGALFAGVVLVFGPRRRRAGDSATRRPGP
jgi:hypothetical protein